MLIEEDGYRIYKKKLSSSVIPNSSMSFATSYPYGISITPMISSYRSRYMKISEIYEIHKNCISHYKGFYECIHDYINITDNDI